MIIPRVLSFGIHKLYHVYRFGIHLMFTEPAYHYLAFFSFGSHRIYGLMALCDNFHIYRLGVHKL